MPTAFIPGDPQKKAPDFAPNPFQEMWRRYRELDKRGPCMDDLFRLAERDAFVRASLTMWRKGDVTLEQALVGIACEMVARCERLQSEAIRHFKAPLGPIKFLGESAPNPIPHFEPTDAEFAARAAQVPVTDEPVPHVAKGNE